MIDQGKLYEFTGSHYEMGYQQGDTFKTNLHKAISMFKNLEEVKSLKPRLIPTGLFMKLASKKAISVFKPIFEKNCPNQVERVKGLAEGSELSEKLIYLLMAAEVMLADLDWELPHIKTGCTSIAYKSLKTKSGNTMVSRNFDYASFLVPYLVLRKNTPIGYNKTIDLTAMILPGTFNGMNEHGVFIGTDEAFPLEEKETGLPASLIIQEALENCQNTEEVVQFFKKVPRGSANVVLVADPSDDIRALEYTSKRLYERTTEKDFIVATNHFTFEELKSIDLPREAVFGPKSPKSLWGVCINETSYIRKKTAEAKIKKANKIDEKWMMALHRDHSADPNGKGGMCTICHHDPENISAASMIFNLKSKVFWMCLGLPCENEYNRYQIKGWRFA